MIYTAIARRRRTSRDSRPGAHDRHVRKGEKGVVILAPMVGRKRTDEGLTEDAQTRLYGFRAALDLHRRPRHFPRIRPHDRARQGPLLRRQNHPGESLHLIQSTAAAILTAITPDRESAA